MKCDDCDTDVRTDELHVFESAAGGIVGRYCTRCCPRCDVVNAKKIESVP